MYLYHKPYFKLHKALFPVKDTLGTAKQRRGILLVKELTYKTLKLRYQYTAHIFSIEHIRINILGTFYKVCTWPSI